MEGLESFFTSGQQFGLFFVSCLFGVPIGIVFDMFRVLRMIFRHGRIAVIIEDILFSGDTLFNLSIGRTDFPGGDLKVLKDSVNKLFSLEGDTTVLSGHGEPTTIDFEKANNPFL